MGSVKDLQVIESASAEVMGVGRFDFSDRFSVFDWGEMPDLIEGKGPALCAMGAYCFERLEEKGIKTHYRGLVNKEGKAVRFDELKEPSSIMEVDIVNVLKPKPQMQEGKLSYDYSVYTPELKNCLIPLEIIYRNGLPEGSSVFRRLKQGKTTYIELGLDHYPEPGERFSTPIFDVSTKLEETDRYISWSEAAKIAALTGAEVDAIKEVLTKANQTITETAANAGLINEDGKIELGFDVDRQLIVVDVVGTLDECRFTLDGFHVSKEVARKFYKNTQWYTDAEGAKKEAQAQGIQDWKSLCKSQPPKLPVELKTVISQMYMSAANEMTGRRFFESPKLLEVVKKYKQLIGE